ncbi:MAG: SDR family oxidoreductase [Gemmatimonadetes bacterium]|nr:SDR family oxidoreductase [Gemmatimonadota bacterium]
MGQRQTSNGAVVVTGASSGIGAAIVRDLAERGFRVFGTVRRARDGEEVEAAGGIPVTLDVAYIPGIERAKDAVERSLGGLPLRALVNNAGIAAVGAIELLDLDVLRKALEVNVVGAVAVTQAFLPLLRAAKGRVVNISSVSARMALPFAGPYAASKAALEAISDSLRRELLPTGVDVIVIQPGSVRTPIWGKIAEIDLRRFAGTIYEPALTRLRDQALKAGKHGLPPEAVAQAVFRAITQRRPPTRILVVGRGQWFQRVVRILPDRFLDWIVKRRLWRGRREKGKEKREK